MCDDCKLTIDAAKSISELYDLEQVIIFARDLDTGKVHQATYGKTDRDAGMAAMDGEKISAMLRALPTSLEDAIIAGSLVRPGDIKRENTVKNRKGNDGVHRTHCCILHGCKYGSSDCPVETGKIKQEFVCETCNAEGFTMRDVHDTFSRRNGLKDFCSKFLHGKDDVVEGIQKKITKDNIDALVKSFCKLLVETDKHKDLRRSEIKSLADVLRLSPDEIDSNLIEKKAR